MTKIRRPRLDVWSDMGKRDGYDGRFDPPKHGNLDCHDAYIDGWAAGTTASIRDQVDKQEKTK